MEFAFKSVITVLYFEHFCAVIIILVPIIILFFFGPIFVLLDADEVIYKLLLAASNASMYIILFISKIRWFYVNFRARESGDLLVRSSYYFQTPNLIQIVTIYLSPLFLLQLLLTKICNIFLIEVWGWNKHLLLLSPFGNSNFV